MRHWHNHFREARDVGLDEIISLVSRYNNNPDPAGREAQIRMWLSQHKKLDAYILPQPSGWHSLGVRYGNEPHEYVSLTADRGPELDALLAGSTPSTSPNIKEEA